MMIIVVVIAIANYVGTRHGSSLLQLLHGNAKAKLKPLPVTTHLSHAGHAPNLTYLLYVLIAVLLLAAIMACGLVIARRRPSWPALSDEIDDDDGASLRQAVESGRAALRAVDEARAAIIACYLAMEGSLATAGTARAAAETPDELLARATGSGLLYGPAAAALTALFYEARFSTHPLPETAKTDATVALDEISAELRDPPLTSRATASSGPARSGPAGEALP